MKAKTIIVSVAFVDELTILAEAEVHITIPESGKVDPSNLVDACQRSVAHCLDELEKHLDRS